MAIFGNGLAANTVQKWAGTGNSANLAGSPSDAYLFGVFQDRLFGVTKAAPTSGFFSDAGDPESNFDATNVFRVNSGDGGDIQAYIPNNDNLIILKDFSKHAMNIVYNDSAVASAPQLQPLIDGSGGCVSPDTAVAVFGSIMYLSDKGFQVWGNKESFNFRTSGSLSDLISSLVEEINLTDKDALTGVFFDDKYICTAPVGTVGVPFTFIYDLKQQGWTIWNGINAIDFAKFRDSKGRQQLYFASDSEAKIFKFNKTYSDDGAAYTGSYKTRTWRFCTKTQWRYLDLYGTMTDEADITLQVTVDNKTKTVTINKDNLITTSLGKGYVGDNYFGQNYFGGAIAGLAILSWHYRYEFPEEINEGRDMFFKLSNNQDGQAFSFNTDYELTVEHISEILTYESSTK